MNKEEKYLNGIEYAKDIGYVQYLDRREDETRLYDCGGIPVELTLPKGKHPEHTWWYNIRGFNIDKTQYWEVDTIDLIDKEKYWPDYNY